MQPLSRHFSRSARFLATRDTLLLIIVSCENLVEQGRLGKKSKPKSGEGKLLEFWSPNFLGRLYQSTVAEAETRSGSTQRLHCSSLTDSSAGSPLAIL